LFINSQSTFDQVRKARVKESRGTWIADLAGVEEGSMETRSTKLTHVHLELLPGTSRKQERELGAFARYCVTRIERELGKRERWVVTIGLASGLGYTSRIAVHHFGIELVATGRGPDGALAIWDGMCQLEQSLRERRGAVYSPRALEVANE
jgi:hypothetical protein